MNRELENIRNKHKCNGKMLVGNRGSTLVILIGTTIVECIELPTLCRFVQLVLVLSLLEVLSLGAAAMALAAVSRR